MQINAIRTEFSAGRSKIACIGNGNNESWKTSASNIVSRNLGIRAFFSLYSLNPENKICVSGFWSVLTKTEGNTLKVLLIDYRKPRTSSSTLEVALRVPLASFKISRIDSNSERSAKSDVP